MGFIEGVGIGIGLSMLTGDFGIGLLIRRLRGRKQAPLGLVARDELEARLTKSLTEQIEWRERALDPEWMKRLHTNRDLADFVPPPKDPGELERWLEEES